MKDIKNKILPQLLLGLIVGMSGLAVFPMPVAAATSVTCKDGTVVSVPIYNDAAAACASHGGLPAVAAGDPNTTIKTTYKFGTCPQTATTIRCLVIEVLKFLSIGVGLAVVGGITVGGITYSTSSGNSSKTQSGMKIIGNSILALVLYFLMFAILHFLVPGGVITP